MHNSSVKNCAKLKIQCHIWGLMSFYHWIHKKTRTLFLDFKSFLSCPLTMVACVWSYGSDPRLKVAFFFPMAFCHNLTSSCKIVAIISLRRAFEERAFEANSPASCLFLCSQRRQRRHCERSLSAELEAACVRRKGRGNYGLPCPTTAIQTRKEKGQKRNPFFVHRGDNVRESCLRGHLEGDDEFKWAYCYMWAVQ